MLGKKIVITAGLSAAFVFGGALHNAEAATSTGSQNQKNQITHIYHYKWTSSKGHTLLNNCYPLYNNVNGQNKPSQPVKEDKPADTGSNDQTVNQQPNKEEAKPAPVKPQEPAKEPAKQEDTKAQSGLSAFEQQVVDLTNKERTSRGLKALQVDTELSKVARAKSTDMAQKGYFAHNSPTYGSPFDMMKQFGITYKSAGENIAKGQRTPQEVVTAWMNSEGHRANILNGSFTHIGVGYVSNGNIWTQQFIGK